VITSTSNALCDFDIAARNKTLANSIGEQRAFEPAAFNEHFAAHHHACSDQAAEFARRSAWLLLRKAKTEAFEDGWWRLLPIEYHASANRTRMRVRPDSMCDCV
jgi:hypothetical protein